MTKTARPRVLLVEDDPTSRAFLGAAVDQVPAHVDAADDIASALELAARSDHELWLFDAHLPDGTGSELLQRLRRRQPDTPALAHTACSEPATREALLAAGFADVLVKPLAAAAVQAAVRGALAPSRVAEAPAPGYGGLPVVWDDDAAARALNGNREQVRTLRDLFLQELAPSGARIGAAIRRGELAGARADLHRLQASCGFVGASLLGAAVRALALQPQQPESLERFEQALRATLDGD